MEAFTSTAVADLTPLELVTAFLTLQTEGSLLFACTHARTRNVSFETHTASTSFTITFFAMALDPIYTSKMRKKLRRLE